MKKIIVLASALFMFNIALNAQDATQKTKPERKGNQHQAIEHKKTPEERAQKHLEQLNIAAGLTEDQKVKVKDLALAKFQKMDAIRDKYKGQKENKEVAKQEKEIVKKEYRQAVKALLTPEQLEKVKKRGQEVKQKRKENKELKGVKPNKKDEASSKTENKSEDKTDNPEDVIIDGQE